jgi:hypothetical protein
MVSHELTVRVRELVELSAVFWDEDPFRQQLFRLCRVNREVTGVDLANALRGEVNETKLHRLALVWNAWRYAVEQLEVEDE